MQNNTEERIAKCGKCGLRLGIIADGGVRFIIENVSVWNEFRYSCICGRAYKFCPIDDFEIANLSDVNRRFIATIGLERRYQDLKEKYSLLKQLKK